MRLPFLILSLALWLSACAPANNPAVDLAGVQTAIAQTANASWTQTALARGRASATPTPARATRTPTLTPTATATVIFVIPTYPTFTPSPPPIPLAWPAWQEGDVVRLRGTSGVTKFFRELQGVKVVVTRLNGVKLREAPTKALGKKMAAYGDLLTLTGYWNRWPDLDWSFVQVITQDERVYWVGGDIGTDIDPVNCLRFYSPFTLTPSPTPVTPESVPFFTLTPTP